MNSIIYSRVSTQDQDNARQIAELKQYALNNKFKVLQVFEEKISGAVKASKRNEFSNLLTYIESNKIDLILVWELSRLGRSMLDVLNTIELLSNKVINIFIKKENMYTLDGSGKKSVMTNMLISILSGFAEMERETTRQRSISGIRNNVAGGGSGSGILKAYGFKKVEKKLLIDEEEAKVVQLIFEKYLSGLGTQQIANYLNDEKILTRYNKVYKEKIVKSKLGYLQKGSDYKWRDGTIYNILTNTIYKGDRKHKNEIFKVPAIITANTFDAVQLRLTSNYNKANSHSKYEKILKDILVCGCCGKNYFMHKRADNSDNAYKCISKRYKNEWCGNPSVNIDKLHNALYKTLQVNLMLSNESKQKSKESIAIQIEHKGIEINGIRKDINKINNQLDKLLKKNLNDEITDKQYSKYKTEFNNELLKKEKTLNKLLSELEKLKTISKNIDSKNTDMTQDYFNANIKNSIKTIIVHPVKKFDKNIFSVKNDVPVMIEVKPIVDVMESTYFMLSQKSKTLALLDQKKNIVQHSTIDDFNTIKTTSLTLKGNPKNKLKVTLKAK